MKKLFFLCIWVASIYACATVQNPNLGKISNGHLVNVDERGVLLHGYDPVSFRRGGSVKGDSTITTQHQGAIYYFSNAANKAEFEANPKAFEPEYGGYCAYGVSLGKLAPIEVWTFDTTYQNHNIFQHNQKAVNGWKQDVAGNYAKAQTEWKNIQKKYNVIK
jgi:YHS domain-containing protein